MFSEQSKINCARSLDMLQVTFFSFLILVMLMIAIIIWNSIKLDRSKDLYDSIM
jgi:hypothetical protein